MLKPPEGIEVFKTYNSEYWFSEGILYANALKGTEPPLTEVKKQSAELKKRMNGKCCAIMDFTNAVSSSREVREYNRKEFMDMFKAIAFISDSAFTRTLAHLFLGFRSLPFPMKVFSNEGEARRWIQQYV